MTLQDLDAAFRARVAKDKKLAEIRRKIAAGKATFKDTAAYSERISNLLGETLSGHIEQIPASERAKVCEWLLRNQYADTNETLATVQRVLDEADGIRLAPQKPPFPVERVNKVSGALEDVTASMDVIRRRANGPVANVSKSFHDDYIRRNAEFRSKAGLPCYIVREAASGCCKWCTEIAGRYECNGDLPEDVYRRHDNCSCTTTYENGRMRQDVWSKRQWEAPEPDAGAEPPTVFTDENRPAGFQPKVLTSGEKTIEDSKKALQNVADGGRILETNISRVFSPASIYKDDKGNFDIQKAKADLEDKIDTVVSQKCAPLLRMMVQAVDYVETDLPNVIFGYDPKTDNVLYNVNHPAFWKTDFVTSNIHELAHRVDTMLVRAAHDNAFSTAVSNMGGIISGSSKVFTDYCYQYDKDEGYLSDILDAGCNSKYRFPFRHGKKYWRKKGNKEKEVFANIFSLEALDNDEKLTFLEKHFPDLMQAYRGLNYYV